MSKKILSIILVMLMVFSLTACTTTEKDMTETTHSITESEPSNTEDENKNENKEDGTTHETNDGITALPQDATADSYLFVAYSNDKCSIEINDGKYVGNTKSIINKKDVSSINGEKELVLENTVLKEEDGYFNASYALHWLYAKSDTLKICPAQESAVLIDNLKENPVYGLQFFDTYMSAKTGSVNDVEFKYCDFIKLNGNTGEFEFEFFPHSTKQHNMGKLEMDRRIKISGKTSEIANIELKWDGEKFILTSDKEISNIASSTKLGREGMGEVTQDKGTKAIIEINGGFPKITVSK